MADTLSYLEECVNATEACVKTQDRAIAQLQKGIQDLPRLTKILHNERHYLLLPEPLLQQYKAELSDSLSPQIDQLIEKAEASIAKSQRRVVDLKQTLDVVTQSSLNPNTLPTSRPLQTKLTATKPSLNQAPAKIPFEMKQLSHAQRKRYIMLKGKKDRLERELAKLS